MTTSVIFLNLPTYMVWFIFFLFEARNVRGKNNIHPAGVA